MATPFRGVHTREALLFEGPMGWSEWSPFLEYDDEEAKTWLSSAIAFAYEPRPKQLRELIPINATLPAVNPESVEAVLSRFGSFSTVKIKVAEPGENQDDDMARIVACHLAYPEAKIRLDANGNYTVAATVRLAQELADRGVTIEYFEQPVRTIEELAEARTALNPLGFLVAADESIRKASDPLEVARREAADILVIKVAPLGGISKALAICAQAGLPSVVSSALDTSVGLSMGLHLAASLPNLEYACGLGTSNLFIDDVCEPPLRTQDGFMRVTEVAPSTAQLSRLAAESERSSWWLNRLERCFELL